MIWTYQYPTTLSAEYWLKKVDGLKLNTAWLHNKTVCYCVSHRSRCLMAIPVFCRLHSGGLAL